MKKLHLSIIALATTLLVSCSGVPSTLPASVTDSYAINTFRRAQAGNSDAKYTLSKMYRHGTYGFPQSTARADALLQDASNDYNPSAAAVYDMSIQLRVQGSRGNNREMGKRYLKEAASLGEPRALAEQNGTVIVNRPQPSGSSHFDDSYVRCSSCGGSGGSGVYNKGLDLNGNLGWHTFWYSCSDCKGEGYVRR